jgi:hypothetical protein
LKDPDKATVQVNSVFFNHNAEIWNLLENGVYFSPFDAANIKQRAFKTKHLKGFFS